MAARVQGEVYRARDTKLGREVAIKVLPEAFASSNERLTRFEREARLLASLNHPHVATLHGFEESGGVYFLVMELVSGETLAERIRRRPLSLDEAIRIFIQVAEALHAAHEKSIVHRDVKPANIKMTAEGDVKLLDFGLAKGQAVEAEDSSQSPTLTKHGTATGVVLGTAPYLSPEQARGQDVDRRTDVWAFGCTLYESLTGRRPFEGANASDIIAGILEREPDWEALPPSTPVKLREILQFCLRKDRKQRLRDLGDIALRMEDVHASEPPPAVSSHGGRLVVASLLGLALGMAAWAAFRSVDGWTGRVVHAVVLPSAVSGDSAPVLPAVRSLSGGAGPALAISPDGTRLAYVGVHEGNRRLYLRELDESLAQPIPGTEGAVAPFFSSDGTWLGFFAGRQIKKVPLTGGATVSIATINSGRGASWGDDDTIVVAPDYNVGLSSVSSIGGEGGELDPLTTAFREARENSHRLPFVLPGSRAVLFTMGSADILSYSEARIEVVERDTGERSTLIEGGTSPHFVATGHLVYAREGDLYGVLFDLERLEIRGASVKLLEGVRTAATNGVAPFAVSDNGTLAYIPGGETLAERKVMMVDRAGNARTLPIEPGPFTNPRLSPDGSQLILTSQHALHQLWVYDLARNILTRFSTTGWEHNAGIWSPDGETIIFNSSEKGPMNLYRQPRDQSRDAEHLVPSEYRQMPGSWARSGAVMAFEESHPETRSDIWTLSLDSDAEPVPFQRTEADETLPAFSPDGRWIAYQSNISGRYEVYLMPFPGPGGRHQVSAEGGTNPRWNPNGAELFYRDEGRVIAVDVSLTREPELGRPRVLFDGRYLPSYDVAPDGDSFVMIQMEEEEPPTEIRIVLNWFDELERKMQAQ